MIKKLLAIIALLMVASLSVAGCTVGLPTTSSPTPTPTPTPTSTPAPPVDYSSYYNKMWEGLGYIVERPFTKSTNVRGNDVYMGVIRNTTLSQGQGATTIIEHTKSLAQSKQLYDQYITQRQNEGYVAQPNWIAQLKSQPNPSKDVWVGTLGIRQFYVWYNPYDPRVQSSTVGTESAYVSG